MKNDIEKKLLKIIDRLNFNFSNMYYSYSAKNGEFFHTRNMHFFRLNHITSENCIFVEYGDRGGYGEIENLISGNLFYPDEMTEKELFHAIVHEIEEAAKDNVNMWNFYGDYKYLLRLTTTDNNVFVGQLLDITWADELDAEEDRFTLETDTLIYSFSESEIKNIEIIDEIRRIKKISTEREEKTE